MKTSENQKSPREYKVYIHRLKTWVEVTEEQYYTYYRDIWANDDFQKQMFGGYPDEETQMQAHTAFADDRRNLRIETTDGLRFFISFHPSFDWINGSGTMSYFKIDEQMHAWIDRNLN